MSETEPKFNFMTANMQQAGGTHYLDMPVQPWEIIDKWPVDDQIAYHYGVMLSYVMRFGAKEPARITAEKIAHVATKLASILPPASSDEDTSK